MLPCDSYIFSGHAIQRMFERRLTPEDVIAILKDGEIIAEYPDDKPLPSMLILGFADKAPLHVVVGVDGTARACRVVTVYVPDPILWDQDFRKRRNQ